VREVVQPAGMIVMMVSENHGGNIRGWIEAHLAQAWTDLFVRCHPDADLGSEKRIPPRQITGRGIFRAVARVYDEPALGMFDQPGEDLQAHPLFVAKNVDLPLEGIAPFAGAFLRRFQLSFACGNGRDPDHREAFHAPNYDSKKGCFAYFDSLRGEILDKTKARVLRYQGSV